MNKIKITNEMVFAVVFVLLALMVIGGTIYSLYNPVTRTTETVKKLVKSHCSHGVQANGIIGDEDAWGNNLKASYVETKYRKTYTVSSAGRDGKHGTSDDIVGVDVDINKSRAVGKWIGGKSKEGVKGLIDGVLGK